MDELASFRIHPATVELANSWIHPTMEEPAPGSIQRLRWMRGADYEHGREEEEDAEKIYANIFLRVHYAGSASAAVRAGTQSLFSANCKRVLRIGGMRGLLEML